MSESTILVLIGGRNAVPVIAGVLQFLNQIERVKFLLCNGGQYPRFQQSIEKVLKQERKDLLCEENDVRIVDPNNFDDVYTAVSELCDNLQGLKYVNLTSVPQTMAISVYSYIKEHHKDALIFSVNTDQSRIILLDFKKESIPFNRQLSVDNYIALHGFNVFRKKGCNEKLDLIVKYFVENIEFSGKILSIIRSKAGGGNDIKIPRGFRINKEELIRQEITSLGDPNVFFEMLERGSIISSIELSEQKIYFKILDKKDYAFLKGDWLELFVYLSAKQCDFDSIEMGVELDNYRGEVDVFCLNNANAMICECKTGKFSSDDLSGLRTKAEMLGGSYCVKLFITSEQNVSKEFLNQATNNQIVVVSGEQLGTLPKILEEQMRNPKYPRR